MKKNSILISNISLLFLFFYSEGTRIDTCEKNIGVKAYAFSTLQLTTFPYQYKAPVGSYQSNLQRWT